MNGYKCAGASLTRAHPKHSLQHETPVIKRREIRDNTVTRHCFRPIDDSKSRLGGSKRISLSSAGLWGGQPVIWGADWLAELGNLREAYRDHHGADAQLSCELPNVEIWIVCVTSCCCVIDSPT